jgi:hypothetical protein
MSKNYKFVTTIESISDKEEMIRVYQRCMGMVFASICVSDYGVYNRDSIDFKIVDSMFMDVRVRAIQVLGKDCVDYITNEFKDDNNYIRDFINNSLK